MVVLGIIVLIMLGSGALWSGLGQDFRLLAGIECVFILLGFGLVCWQSRSRNALQVGAGTLRLPDEAPQDTDRLGPILTVYHTPKADTLGLFLMSFFFLGAGAVGGSMVWDDPRPSKLWLLAFGCPPLGLFLLYKALRNVARPCAALYCQEGILLLEGKGGTVCLFEDMGDVFHNPGGGHTYTIVRRDGEKMVLSGFALGRLGKLADRIDRELSRRHFPRLLQFYEAGEPVEFGPISVSSAGLVKGNSTLPWASVTSAEIDGEFDFTVKQRGSIWAWCGVPVRKIPNLHMFLQLVEKRVQVPRPWRN
jgi:hypothetical protein